MARDEFRNVALGLGNVQDDLPWPCGELVVPAHIALHENSIRWTSGPWSKRVTPPKGLLANFVRLHDKTRIEIFEYAQRFGVLGLCEHNLPHPHSNCKPLKVGKRSLPFGRNDPNKTIEHDVCEESIDGWRVLSREAAALQEMAAIVNQTSTSGDAEFSSNRQRRAWRMKEERRMKIEERIPHLNTGIDDAIDIYDVWAPYLLRGVLADRISKWLIIGGAQLERKRPLANRDFPELLAQSIWDARHRSYVVGYRYCVRHLQRVRARVQTRAKAEPK